ncbi:hypothetical protein JG688_00003658 [Phytophthora aleatoria]|uniref:Uncharacterized protein n=1 Tax=Phytophthora aleatoria TaxID=2496075 RepID=A0A8J5JA77_9STRA|nr:hypothetical protein JG688_00003658 [Phytophthora aleatoria]
MRADPAVSKRLQQAAEQLQDAIRSARKRRQSVGDAGESLSGKAWQLPPTVLQTPEQDEYEDDMIEAPQQESLDEKVESDGTSLASGSMLQTPTKGEAEMRAVEVVHDEPDRRNAMESDMRKALDWMQRDVERQARENRAVRETLARAIHDITDVVADFVDKKAANVLVLTAAAATGVSPETDNNASMVQLAPDKVDELVGLWDDALVSWREQNVVEKQELMEGFTLFEEECLARMKAGETSHKLEQERLALEANQQQMVWEDYTSSLRQKLESANSVIESLQAQKLELLEGRMQDVLQQVACDHEQFEYEQAKWALEKRQQREKYDEVLDASVKVLKVLIIREKLMKKNERAQKRVNEECQEKQLELACQAATLQGITTEIMQQSAMVLLVLQQLAVLKSNTSQLQDKSSTWTLPAKPVQMKSMIKRLKKIETATKASSPNAMHSAIQLLQLLLVALPAVANAGGCVTKACTLDCTLDCQPGKTCVVQTVTCIRAPCPPIQTCVATFSGSKGSNGVEGSPACTMECGDFQECRIYEPNGSEYCADVCAEGRCPEGFTCELQEVQCIRAPCPPVATCNNATGTQSDY